MARAYLTKAAKKMKKWADVRRQPMKYHVGDKIMVKLLPQQFKVFRKVHKGLIRKYEGPFEVVGKVENVSYKVQLPPNMKIHPVFHVSMLKPYNEDVEDPLRNGSSRAPPLMTKSFEREVDEVLVDQIIWRRGIPQSTQYLVKWKRLPTSEATWENEQELWQFKR
ncbi:uncharacterized protein LOC141704713 [Apium graveolens]|uniref:uncharacterized protein LOC141704713 n=1 Tax=Apium graveolens TaxID=4045 RepID=UPI003D7AC4F3